MKITPFVILIFCLVITLNAQVNDTTSIIETLIKEGDIEKAREILSKNYDENDVLEISSQS